MINRYKYMVGAIIAGLVFVCVVWLSFFIVDASRKAKATSCMNHMVQIRGLLFGLEANGDENNFPLTDNYRSAYKWLWLRNVPEDENYEPRFLQTCPAVRSGDYVWLGSGIDIERAIMYEPVILMPEYVAFEEIDGIHLLNGRGFIHSHLDKHETIDILRKSIGLHEEGKIKYSDYALNYMHAATDYCENNN
jgi:hypothetical protein